MFANVRVATRIAGGYVLILLLLAVLAGFAYAASSRLGSLAERLERQFEAALLAATAALQTNEAMLDMERFLSDPGSGAEGRVMGELAEARQAIGALAAYDLAATTGLRAATEAYAAEVGRIMETAARRETQLQAVESLGITHRRDIGRLAQMLEDRGVHDLAYVAVVASDAFLTTRVRVDRFLAGGELAEYESAAGPLERTQTSLQSLAAAPLTAEERAQLAAARTGVAAYAEVVAEARDIELTMRTQTAALDEVTAGLYTATVALRSEVADIGRAVGVEKSEVVGQTHATLLLGTAGAIGLGLVVAVLLSLAIVRPLKRSVEQTRRLADGDLEAEISGAEGRNELADLARALEVFQQNQREARRLAEETEAERAAAAARQTEELSRQSRVVGDLEAGLRRLADGDLTREIESPAADPFPSEYEALRAAYNDALARLSAVMSGVSDVADALRSSAGEISQAASNLSSRAETQAATLEQSAAALNELTESVRSTADRASSAEKASKDNFAEAKAGEEVVREAISAMKAIERSAEQITRIIGAIDDIAFQTNLLALNAGVEAARAGEAGRGFAVVASEVRALAQRASESAREIKGLISESGAHVETGSALVARTGESLERILAQASQVSALMAEIAVAAAEQASGLSEVNGGVAQLDQVTQENAAAAEETTAASATLNEKASDLTVELAAFRVDRHRSSAPAVRGAGDASAATVTPLAPVATQVRPRAMRMAAPADPSVWQEF